MNRKDLQDLSKIRLKEASALLRLRLFDGAYYLTGYAVECAIKACIAKRTQRGEFPDKGTVNDSYSHDLKLLIKTARLEKARTEEAATDSDFKENWDIVTLWSEQTRYRRSSAESTLALMKAVSDSRHGVMSWIKQQW